ncbi:MAG: phenylalanine--tRNA ligase subunit beta [Planctomycetes bacterium]|nr:phenylalanine--tRNA ligase subunit beta [Planctomycetota bacterium]
MKIPLSWLRDYIDITFPPALLIERLTLAGLEVASTRVLGLPIPEGVRVKPEERGPVWDRDKIVIAQVLGVEKHPNADKLKLPTVTWGEGTLKQLVTGAPNINVGDKGQKVVLALSGSVLFDGHSEERKLSELKPTTIRGLPSDAMVCSLLELGISDNKEDHTGIIILEDDAPVGTPLADFMGDIVIEVDVLPNTARCLAMIGVAREVAAIAGQKLKLPSASRERQRPEAPDPIAGQIAVQIENPKLSARYAAALIKNITVGPAPGWMQRRLLYAGMRPINNIVDITNFVMLEWGQPLHAFDYDILVQRAGGKAPTIIVRPARDGEVLVTLDKQERKLSSEHLVIADTKGPIALAGVMGGLDTEVTEKTKNILLESASFDFVSIRKTFRQFDLPSEASARFSRGIHPETVKPAAERAADLMRQYAGGSVCQGLVDCYPAPRPAQVVDFDLRQMDRLLGFQIEPAEAIRILLALEYGVAPLADGRGSEKAYKVTVPTHRLDVQEGVADLVEDIVRIYGYDRVPTTLLAEPLPKQQANEPIQFEERVRDILVDCGLQEVICYALTVPEKEAPLLPPRPTGGEGSGVRGDRDYVTLKNPISNERVVMRQSVLASVLEIAESNLRNTDDVRLFEIGFAYIPHRSPHAPREESVTRNVTSTLPDEPRRLAIVMVGNRGQEFWNDGGAKEKAPLDFFELKGVIEALTEDLHLKNTAYQPAKAAHLHPGKSATLLVSSGEPSRVSDRVIGDFGVLHPKVAQAYGLGERTVLVAEFDVEALQTVTPIRFTYTPVPRFPAALRDIAVVVDEAIPAEQIESEIRKAGGELLSGVRLFDLYRGNQIPPGTKSLAYALSYQAADRTLTDKEIDKAHKKIEDRLKNVLKATIRGKE